MYTALHIHDTKGSLLDSILRIEEIVQFCKENDMKSVALTNHGKMHSFVSFQEKCLKENIKPIHGCEIYLVEDMKENRDKRYHMVLLAKNKIGLKNLFKISKISHENHHHKPIIDLKTIQENNLGEGLISTTACIAGYIYRNHEDKNKISKFISQCKETFDYFALEIQAHRTQEAKKLAEICMDLKKEYSLPCVVTTDSHYLKKEDIEAHAIFVEIGSMREIGEGYVDCYLQPFEDLKRNTLEICNDEAFFEECYKETNKIADMVEIYDIGIGQPSQMPHIEVPKEYSNSEEFYDSIVKKSLEDKILYDVELTKKRVNSEKEVLKELGYIDYFLMLRELTEVAKKNNIPVGYSRGSGANCMSLYMMGVTQVDSIRWDLDFSRFANLGRKGSVADYDMDISQNKREEFITLIKEKYGYDKTMAIATFSTLTTKVAIRDIAKVLTTKGIYKIPYSIAHEVMNLIPSVKTLNEIDDEEVKDEQLKNVLNKIPKLKEYYEKFPKWFELVMRLEGLPKGLGKHPSGILITPNPIVEYCPVCLDSDKNLLCQLDMKDSMDKLGLVKMDILGLRNLDIADETMKLIGKTWDDFNINTIDLDDKNVFKQIFETAHTDGVFQYESLEAKRMLKECGVDRIEDVFAISALNRPGAKISFPEYVNNKKNGTINCKKELEPIFKSTNGVLVYQEQMLKIFGLAGFDETEQDKARRAVGKKDKETMVKLESKFKEGFKKFNWTEQEIKELWELMLKQSEYSFNLGHTTGYGLMSYLTGLLKYYYPKEYMTALLNSVLTSPNDMANYLAECERMNIKVLPPNINKSSINFKSNGNSILFGFSAIKGIGVNYAEKIIENQPYNSVSNFIEVCKPNIEQCVQLIKAGCFGSNKRLLLEKFRDSFLENKVYENKSVTKATLKKYGLTEEQYNVKKKNELLEKQNKKNLEIVKSFNEKYITEEDSWEIESLNMFLTKNPFNGLKIKDFYKCKDKSQCVVVGAIVDIQNKKDKKNKKYVYIKVYTTSGIIEGVVWASIYAEYQNLIKRGQMIVCLAKKDGNQFSVKEIKGFYDWKKEHEKLDTFHFLC